MRKPKRRKGEHGKQLVLSDGSRKPQTWSGFESAERTWLSRVRLKTFAAIY